MITESCRWYTHFQYDHLVRNSQYITSFLKCQRSTVDRIPSRDLVHEIFRNALNTHTVHVHIYYDFHMEVCVFIRPNNVYVPDLNLCKHYSICKIHNFSTELNIYNNIINSFRKAKPIIRHCITIIYVAKCLFPKIVIQTARVQTMWNKTLKTLQFVKTIETKPVVIMQLKTINISYLNVGHTNIISIII